VKETVEETLNAMLKAEADRLCNASRYEWEPARPSLLETTIRLCFCLTGPWLIGFVVANLSEPEGQPQAKGEYDHQPSLNDTWTSWGITMTASRAGCRQQGRRAESAACWTQILHLTVETHLKGCGSSFRASRKSSMARLRS